MDTGLWETRPDDVEPTRSGLVGSRCAKVKNILNTYYITAASFILSAPESWNAWDPAINPNDCMYAPGESRVTDL